MIPRSRALGLTAELAARVAPVGPDATPGPMPAGRRPAEEPDHARAVRDILATAPPGGEVWVLRSTVEHLEALGIHDRHLWRLQDMVADSLDAVAAT